MEIFEKNIQNGTGTISLIPGKRYYCFHIAANYPPLRREMP